MWHEARRQERKIRVMMVDYQKRADRRRQFYEQIVSHNTLLMYSTAVSVLPVGKKKVKTWICIARLMYKTPLTRIYVTETELPGRYLCYMF